MGQTSLGAVGNDPWADALRRVIATFLDEWTARTDLSIRGVVTGSHELEGHHVGQEPERFTVEHLVRPVLEDVFGYEYRPQPRGLSGFDGQTPDFLLADVEDSVVIGEVKVPPAVGDARTQSFDYLTGIDASPVVGIATDGVTWALQVPDGDRLVEQTQVPLHKTFNQIAIEKTSDRSAPPDPRELRKQLGKFVTGFNPDALREAARVADRP